MEGETPRKLEQVLADPRPNPFSGLLSDPIHERAEKLRARMPARSDSQFYAWLVECGLHYAEKELEGRHRAARATAPRKGRAKAKVSVG